MSRPVSTGTGVRVSAYIPLALWKRLDQRINQMDGVPVSCIVQEAVARYLDDMDDFDKMDAYYAREDERREAESNTAGV